MDVNGTFQYQVPNMMYYERRLSTFALWPKLLSKYELAAAGLFYTNEQDAVKCFVCGVKLSQWTGTEKPFTEHRRWSPDCVFLKMIGCELPQSFDQPDDSPLLTLESSMIRSAE